MTYHTVKHLIIILLLILLILAPSGCIFENNNNKSNNNDKYISYSFNIEIISNNTLNFEILIPAPIFFENKSLCHDIINNIEIEKGYPQITTELTPYGKALKISGNGNIIINSEGTLNRLNQKGPTIFLSLEYSNNTINTFSTEKFWVFCNESNIILMIELLNDYLDGGYYKYISKETKLMDGWQIIDIKEIIKVT